MSKFTQPPKAELLLSQFNYSLPNELIAQQPAKHRTESRLLHLDPYGNLHDLQFPNLIDLVNPGDLLVFNNTKVIKARIFGNKNTGGRVEILIERVISPNKALAHIKSSKAPKPGAIINLNGYRAEVLSRREAIFELQFDNAVYQILEHIGSMPLPPYIDRQAAKVDDSRYQTIYASIPGAVAAPTAGLHFDSHTLLQLKQQGVNMAYVTLHVGAGTFQPVRTEKLIDHKMHAEKYSISAETIQAIYKTKENNKRVIAIGTTSARALESAAINAAHNSGTPNINTHGAEADTNLFITPGYEFRWTDALLTNFHLPQSTLLMLVSALAGMEPIKRAYEHAVQSRYRFFSYGDAMFIEPPVKP